MREAASFIAGQQSASTGLLSSVAAATAQFYRNWKSRRELVHLSELDDHVLADIGISRGDVHAALSQPSAYAASLHLQRAAEQNRSRWARS